MVRWRNRPLSPSSDVGSAGLEQAAALGRTRVRGGAGARCSPHWHQIGKGLFFFRRKIMYCFICARSEEQL